MADKTGIEWTDSSWNPIVGCSIVSAGCTNCYAMQFANRLLDKPDSHYHGTTRVVNNNAVWTGKVALAHDDILTQPLQWKRPRKIFVNSMGDLFHESVPDAWIDQVFAVMALAPQHTFQILTKRSKRMRDYCNGSVRKGLIVDNEAISSFAPRRYEDRKAWPYPLPNVWLGVSVENQDHADARIPDLLQTPAAVRFLSCEPLLGAVDLNRVTLSHEPKHYINCLDGWMSKSLGGGHFEHAPTDTDVIDWVIAGGESGKGARPMHPDWIRNLRDDCIAAGTPFFFKQWGEYAPMFPHYPEEYGLEDEYQEVNLGFPKEGIMYRDGYFYNGIEHQAHVNSGAFWIERIGKKKAGRLLDGVAWNQFPKGGA